MEKIKIIFVDDAFFEGFYGATLRYRDDYGRVIDSGLCDFWYEGRAIDSNDNEYYVFWEITNIEALLDDGNVKDAFDQDRPYLVIDKHGRNVTKKIEIVDVSGVPNNTLIPVGYIYFSEDEDVYVQNAIGDDGYGYLLCWSKGVARESCDREHLHKIIKLNAYQDDVTSDYDVLWDIWS